MAWAIAAITLLFAFLFEGNVGASDSGSDSAEPALPNGSEATSSGVSIIAPGDISSGGDMDAVSKFVLGIWKTEGMGPNDRAVRNNNPGNLKFAGQAGATKDPNSDFAVFGSWKDGFDAAVRQVQLDAKRSPDFTILQEMRKWLGMDPNGAINVTNQGNALTKAQTVAATVGANPTDTLRNVLGV